MANSKVPVPEITTVSYSALAQEIASAAKKLFGEDLNENQIAIILAQNALETGHRKHMYNNNIGNIKYTGNSDTHDYIELDTKEYSGDRAYTEKAAKFRAYDSLADGVSDYLKLLKRNGKGIAWEAMKSGDPEVFSRKLKQIGYYTAPEEQYTASLVEIFNKNKNKNKNVQPIKLDKSENKGKFQIALNKIFNLISGMQLSIAAYDAALENRILKKGKYGNRKRFY